MGITDRDIEKARERGRRQREESSWAVSAKYDRRSSRIVIGLANGFEFSFPPELAQGLAGASAADLSDIEISPSGLGVHWSRLDADFSVPGLMQGRFGSDRWMAQRMGQAGGKSRSKAKARAARENGKRGGRPRKMESA